MDALLSSNTAAWLPAPGRQLNVAPAPVPHAGPGEVVLRARAVAVNPVDWIVQSAGRLMFRWLRYPAIVGFDVAGDVVDVGAGVTRVRPGDRILGLAVGAEKGRGSRESAFQELVVLQEHLVTQLPEELSYEDACVLPLAISTAACGLFQTRHLGLRLPVTAPGTPTPSSATTSTSESVLIWGGSTSVGGNAIQLAVAAGYDVVSTASPRNADAVRRLGARVVVDHGTATAVDEAVAALAGRQLAGALALGEGSAEACSAVLAASSGRRVVAVATGPVSFAAYRHSALAMTRIGVQMVGQGGVQLLRDRRRGVRSAIIWGASLSRDDLGAAVFSGFLPAALASGAFACWPAPLVVGHGPASLQEALETHRRGVSARKVVVTM